MKEMKDSVKLDEVLENACLEIKKGSFNSRGAGNGVDTWAYGAGDKCSSKCEEENVII